MTDKRHFVEFEVDAKCLKLSYVAAHGLLLLAVPQLCLRCFPGFSIAEYFAKFSEELGKIIAKGMIRLFEDGPSPLQSLPFEEREGMGDFFTVVRIVIASHREENAELDDKIARL